MNKNVLHLAALLLLCGCPDEPNPPGSMTDGAADADAGGDAGGDTRTDAGVDASGDARVDARTDASASTVGDAGSEDVSLEERTIAKLKQCGLYEAEGAPNQYSVEDAYDVCVAQCTLGASCAAMKQLVCEDRDSGFTDCLDGCDDAPRDGFRCTDGSRIPHAALCDLFPDCANDEDERACGEFVCADGEIIPARSARCDWIEDCLDGSDERGCMLVCN